MDSLQTPVTSIDEYIAQFPPEIQKLLGQMRSTIRKAAPAASEKISYRLATFYLQGNLVHFGAFKNHIGFYPTPSGIEPFMAELAGYATSKGAINFPLNQPLPLELVAKITRQRVAENLARAEVKTKKPKK